MSLPLAMLISAAACCLLSAQWECSIGCLWRIEAEGLRHRRLHRSPETDSTNRGEEAPVFGSRNPLFFDPSYPPKHRLLRARSVVGSVTSKSLVLSVLFWALKVSHSDFLAFFACLASLSGLAAAQWRPSPAVGRGASIRSAVFIGTTCRHDREGPHLIFFGNDYLHD